MFQLLSSPDVNWWTGVVWITCGLLWCFYQLFGLSFWRHPFTAEHPLLRHWCSDTFLQTWWRNKLILIWRWAQLQQIISMWRWKHDVFNMICCIVQTILTRFVERLSMKVSNFYCTSPSRKFQLEWKLNGRHNFTIQHCYEHCVLPRYFHLFPFTRNTSHTPSKWPNHLSKPVDVLYRRVQNQPEVWNV